MARVLEEKGITTVTLSMFEEVLHQIKPPRAIISEFPFGAPFGSPNNRSLHVKIIKECLEIAAHAQEPGSFKEIPYKWIEKLD